MLHVHRGGRGAPATVVLSIALMLSIALSLIQPVYAAGGIQGNLTGTIRDAETQAPIADVSVTAQSPSGSFSGTTDGGGHFTLLGLPADTYTVSFSKTGYDSISEPGIAVFGDETDSVGVVHLNKSLKTIVHVTSRARSSAYQPSQTQDVTTISGQRITQALGFSTNQNETNLILAAPGAILDPAGNISVRGSLNVELGFQYDGVNFSGVFFDENASQGFLSNITGGSGGSLQVVSGSGDATQGNIGAGVINIVPPRGTYPASGLASVSVAEPDFNHGLNLNYGFATPNNRFSDFISYDGSRFLPAGVAAFPAGTDAASAGLYGGVAYGEHDDLVNNMVFRFGHQNNMSLQWLVRAADLRDFANYGQSLPSSNVTYYPFNPFYYGSYAGAYQSLAEFQATTPLLPGVPATNVLPTTPEEAVAQPLSFNKLAYTWNINPTTFLSLSYANLYLISQNNSQNYSGTPANASQITNTSIGGQRLADELDLTHQFGSNHTTTLAIRYEDDLPYWNEQAPWFGELTTTAITPSFNDPTKITAADWYLPTNPGQPVSTANPCVGPLNPAGLPNGGAASGCYIYSQLLAQGAWTGALPRQPTLGLDYHHTIFHEGGIGLRDQWTVSPRLHLDYGVREDIANYDFGENPFGNGNDKFANPSDVQPTAISAKFFRPRFTEPRFAASYLLGANDSIRFSYGRSVEFPFAQTAGTPFGLLGADPIYAKIAPKDTAANPDCGSGVNTQKYGPGALWQCQSYLQQFFWGAGDQFLDAPDLGGTQTPSFNNYDLAWGHQFTRGALDGFGLKLTGFARHGYNVGQDIVLAYGPPDPVTGAQFPAVFTVANEGVERTAGAEFLLTAPDRPYGWSGFLTLNYISQFENEPPVTGGGLNTNQVNDQLPIVNAAVFRSGQFFRSGYLPPFQGRVSVSYATRSGWKFNPIFAFDGGFPVGIGANTFDLINGTNYAFFPSSSLPGAAPIGGAGGPYLGFNAPSFVDPGNPGSLLHPNIIATRGFSEPGLPGGTLSKAHGSLDFDVEWSPQGSPWTMGAYVANVFNEQYGLFYSNNFYQPVATGVPGPLSGKFASAYPGSFTFDNGARDSFAGNLPNSPYSVPLQEGTNIQFYLQRKL